MTGLLEREHELARIAAGLGGATGGTGYTIHVEGSAGIGKTSLLGTTAEMARASGKYKVAATPMVGWGDQVAGRHVRFVFSNEPVERLQVLGDRVHSALRAAGASGLR